jgi:hypothetical protein
MAGTAGRCRVCNQTVAVVDGVIQTHNRVLGAKSVRCAGSGQSA